MHNKEPSPDHLPTDPGNVQVFRLLFQGKEKRRKLHRFRKTASKILSMTLPPVFCTVPFHWAVYTLPGRHRSGYSNNEGMYPLVAAAYRTSNHPNVGSHFHIDGSPADFRWTTAIISAFSESLFFIKFKLYFKSSFLTANFFKNFTFPIIIFDI